MFRKIVQYITSLIKKIVAYLFGRTRTTARYRYTRAPRLYDARNEFRKEWFSYYDYNSENFELC